MAQKEGEYIYLYASKKASACMHSVLAHLYDDLSLLQTLEEEHVEPC